jgi:hypothetical protein
MEYGRVRCADRTIDCPLGEIVTAELNGFRLSVPGYF